jgi:DNA-binding transcriptional MerR regulator
LTSGPFEEVMRVATRNPNIQDETKETTGGKLYYSISEVAELVSVKPHVLRYWETQFKMLRPRKNRAGNRSYRVKDVKMALRIRRLLYDEGFTIAGARRKLLDERRDGQTELDFVGISKEEFLKMMRRDLTELLQVLRGEKPIEALGHQDDDEERLSSSGRRRGLFADLAMHDQEPEDGELDDEALEADDDPALVADDTTITEPAAFADGDDETAHAPEIAGQEPNL